MNKHLVLIGMMGSGKTTVASWLHRHGGFPFYDTDHLIEKKEGKPIPDIFKESGEPYFRDQERRVTHELVKKTPGVIATGGGLFADEENRRLLLQQGIVFYLQASSDDLAARIRNTSHRPLLANKKSAAATLDALLEKRDALYRQAHHVVSIAGRATDAVASEIMELFQQSTVEIPDQAQRVLGFLGAGKMARAVAGGLAHRGGQAVCRAFAFPFLATARTEKTRALFVKALPSRRAEAVADNQKLVERSDIVLIGLKPSDAAAILPPLREAAAGKLFVSLMAGIPLARLREWLGPQARIVRAMPNTPALIGKGITAYSADKSVTAEDLEAVRLILEGCGKALPVEEKELNAVTSVSGSGPAYVYHFIEALMTGGIEQGLSPQVARQLAVETVLGAAAMAAASAESPQELAAQVKSPNGTTVAGCQVLQERGWEHILRDAIAAARARADAMGQEL